MQNKCAEIKIRAERRAGELLKDMERVGEVIAHGGDRKSTSHDVSLKSQPITQKEAGFDNYMEAHRCKTLADMPEEDFEKHIINSGNVYSSSSIDINWFRNSGVSL